MRSGSASGVNEARYYAAGTVVLGVMIQIGCK